MPFRKLPPTIRQTPEVSDAWHQTHAESIEDHENRLLHLERGFHLSTLLNKQVKTPLGDLPLPLAIAGGATLIWWKPDLVLKLFG